MRRTTNIAAAVASLLLGLVSVVLADAPYFEHWNRTSGLPGDSVYSVTQDSAGRLWFGGPEGLASFDGYQFRPFLLAQTMSAVDVRALDLLADTSAGIWVATERHGILHVNNHQKLLQFVHDPLDSETLSSNHIRALSMDIEGNLWSVTAKGVDRVDRSTGKTRRYSTRSPPRSILIRSSGEVWVGTNSGVERLNQATGLFEIILPELGGARVFSLHEQVDDRIWLATARGAYLIDARRQLEAVPIERLVGVPVTDIHTNADGTWFSTIDRGLLYQSSDARWEHYQRHDSASSVADDAVLNLYEDREGSLWIGTFNNGAVKLSQRALAFGRHDGTSSAVACVDNLVVHSLLAEQDVLWLGTESGLVRYHRTTRSCTVLQTEEGGPLKNMIKAVIRDSASALWVGTGEGLAPVDESAERIDSPVVDLPVVSFVHELPSKALLVGSNSGLFKHHPATARTQPIPVSEAELQGEPVSTHFVGIDGRHWFGTSQGLATLVDDRLQRVRFGGRPAVPHKVQSVFAAPDDTLWVGVEDRGLWRIDLRSQHIEQIGSMQSFPVTLTTSPIVGDSSGDIWVGSRRGITHLRGNGTVVRTYGPKDGLQAHWFSAGAATKTDAGELIFGGKQGFNAFFPQDVTSRSAPPLPAITKIVADDQDLLTFGHTAPAVSVDTADGKPYPILQYPIRDVAFEFSALSYINADLNRYQYRLLGQDPEWRTTEKSQRLAQYTNLAPGDYIFEVRASNADNVWSTQPAATRLTVLPAWWETGWATLLGVVLAIASVVGFVRWRLNYTIRYANELESEVASRTREISRQKTAVEALLSRKSTLFENVSHELKTPLTLIIGPLKQLSSTLSQSPHRETFEIAMRNSEQLLERVNQILQIAESSVEKPDVLIDQEVAPILRMLTAGFSIEAKRQNANLALASVASMTVRAPADTLEIAAGNLISNAIKYGGNQITIHASQEGEFVQVTVKDDGCAIPPEEIDTIFNRFRRLADSEQQPGHGLGLAVTREIVEASGGRVFVTSRSGETEFGFTLPSGHRSTAVPANPVVSANQEPPASSPQVVVIDDNQDIGRYIRSILEPEYSVTCHMKPEQGLKDVALQLPDLVICDVMMPKIDGFKVLRQLRNSDLTSHIPVILLTAKGGVHTRTLAWEESADAFVQKPFDPTELRSRITSLLSVRRLLSERLAAGFAVSGRIDSDELTHRDQAFVEKLNAVFEAHYMDSDLDRNRIASKMAVSGRQLQRKLQVIVGKNPSELLREFRLLKGKEILDQGYQVSIAADRSGFSSSSYFARCFREKFGLSPTKYQAERRQ